MLGNLSYLTALLPVEEDGLHRRRLAVDEDAAETLAQGRVGEVRSAGGKLLIPLGRLDVTCESRSETWRLITSQSGASHTRRNNDAVGHAVSHHLQ